MLEDIRSSIPLWRTYTTSCSFSCVCTRRLPDLHFHDHRAPSQFGRGRGDLNRGRGGGRGGRARGVLLKNWGVHLMKMILHGLMFRTRPAWLKCLNIRTQELTPLMPQTLQSMPFKPYLLRKKYWSGDVECLGIQGVAMETDTLVVGFGECVCVPSSFEALKVSANVQQAELIIDTEQQGADAAKVFKVEQPLVTQSKVLLKVPVQDQMLCVEASVLYKKGAKLPLLLGRDCNRCGKGKVSKTTTLISSRQFAQAAEGPTARSVLLRSSETDESMEGGIRSVTIHCVKKVISHWHVDKNAYHDR
eukprot:5986356-Amphidinium_carterae.1